MLIGNENVIEIVAVVPVITTFFKLKYRESRFPNICMYVFKIKATTYLYGSDQMCMCFKQ